MTDQRQADTLGLNALHIDTSAAHYQDAADLLTLLDIAARLHGRIAPPEYASLTLITQQLCRELNVPYSLFQAGEHPSSANIKNDRLGWALLVGCNEHSDLRRM